MFKLTQNSTRTHARTGTITTPHGKVQTPFFMPIATKGAVKSLDIDDVYKLPTDIILSNTYHLYLEPGLRVLEKYKGLHRFMNWDKVILTDSGGYQVFSLSERTRTGKSLRRITPEGVEFRSFLDGSKHLFTPEKVQRIQDIIGSDIKMVLDICSPYPCSKSQAEKDMNITHTWAKKALKYHRRKNRLTNTSDNLLFAIVQGSTYKDLRIKSAEFLTSLDFDGYAIGGLAVGEANDAMYKVLDYIVDYLPTDKPRYLMGVGKPENIVEAVKRGVDMFDCVIPTREARHGRLYFMRPGKRVTDKNFYEVINIKNAKYRNSLRKLDNSSYTLGYLHHLFRTSEPLALTLATRQNLGFYVSLMKQIRKEIKNKNL